MGSNYRSFDGEEVGEKSRPPEHVVVGSSPPPLMIATISLSPLSIMLPSATRLLFQLPNDFKISLPSPCRVNIVSARAVSSPALLHRKIWNAKSISSANPFISPFNLGPRLPADPSIAGGARRCTICWFRNDLRLHDNECLTSANSDSFTVLPVYCFDPKDYAKAPSGTDKAMSFRASFVIQSVADLRNSLRARGSDLIIRIGSPEIVLTELARKVGAGALYVHGEVSPEDIVAEDKVQDAMEEEGIDVKLFWGSTLFNLNDLPFKLEEMPSNHGSFREKVEALQIRETIPIPDDLKALPSASDLEPGEVPTLMDLGHSHEGSSFLIGGETEALQRMKTLATEWQTQEPSRGSHESMQGTNFSCRISPWLTMGCTSPRFLLDNMKNSSSSTSGMHWLMAELLSRDFFRFTAAKIGKRKALNRKSTVAVQ